MFWCLVKTLQASPTERCTWDAGLAMRSFLQEILFSTSRQMARGDPLTSRLRNAAVFPNRLDEVASRIIWN